MRNLTSAHALARINNDDTKLFLRLDGEPEVASKEKRIAGDSEINAKNGAKLPKRVTRTVHVSACICECKNSLALNWQEKMWTGSIRFTQKFNNPTGWLNANRSFMIRFLRATRP